LPEDLDEHKDERKLAEDRLEQVRAKAALKAQKGAHMTENQLKTMQTDIDHMLVT
jgi:hypothetical protein